MTPVASQIWPCLRVDCVLPFVSGLALKCHQSYSKEPQAAAAALPASGVLRAACTEAMASDPATLGPAQMHHTCGHLSTHTSHFLSSRFCFHVLLGYVDSGLALLNLITALPCELIFL